MDNTIKATPENCSKAETYATLSSCCGFLGEVTLTDSAIIILFAGMLGASDMVSIITTSFLPLFNGFLIIPMAWLATKWGGRKLILTSCISASAAYFMAVTAPFWGAFAVAVLVGMIVIFAFSLTGFIASWFPLLDTFVKSDKRTIFFSKMRFTHQITAVSFLFLVGFLIGKEPPAWKLQLILLAGAIIFTGRAFFISRIPRFTTPQKEEALGFKEGLIKVLENKPLTGFSIYLFMLNLAAHGTIPLMMLYLKKQLNAPDNVVVFISATTLVGMLLGYLCANKIIKRWDVKGTLLGIHISYIFVNTALFLISEGSAGTFVATAILLFFYSFMVALASIVTSSEMMALASPANKTMAMAFCGSFYYGGSGFSRLVSSLMLGSGLLAPEWKLGGMLVCHYQTLFFIYALFILLAAVFLISVPAIFPNGQFAYYANS